MAASKRLYEIVGDVTECPICTEVIVDSKVLPCIHTFCLKCLEQFWRDKRPGDSVPCPLCRTAFHIPAGGLSELPRNFFVEKLLEAKRYPLKEPSNETCDICSRLTHKKGGMPSPATNYCVDCQNHMCEQCANVHLLMKSSEDHHMVEGFQEMEVSMKYSTRQCDQHKDKKIEIYCLDCKTAVCMACFIIKHNGHKCSDIKDVTEDLRKQIHENLQKINELFIKVNEQTGNLERVMEGLGRDTKTIEAQIVRRGDEIKELVDKHVESLIQELNDEKTRNMKELENVKEELLVQKISLESFMRYSQKVLDTATPSDLASSASDLSARANSLAKINIVSIEKLVQVVFTPANPIMHLGKIDEKNIIGDVIINNGNLPSEYFNLSIQLQIR